MKYTEHRGYYREVHNCLENDVRLFLSMEAQWESWNDNFLEVACEEHERVEAVDHEFDIANNFLMG